MYRFFRKFLWKDVSGSFRCKLTYFLWVWLIFAATLLPAQSSADSLRIAELSKNLAGFVKTNQLDAARLTVDSILEIAQDNHMHQKMADCYNNYSLIERKRGNEDGFLENSAKAADLYMAAGAFPEAAKSLSIRAQWYVDQKNYPLAHDLFSKSLELREKAGDTTGIINNLINIGNLNYIEGNPDEASNYFYRALRLANDMKNNNLSGILLMNLSNVLIQQKNYSKAIEYLTQSLDYHRKDGNRKEEANVLNNIGIIYFETGDYKKAREFFLRSLAIKEEINTDPAGLIKIYNNLGLIAKEENNPGLAEEYYTSTLRISHQAGDKSGEAVALNNLGSLKLLQNDPDALPLLLQSIELSQTLGLKKLTLANYDNLQKHYSAEERWKEAFEYLMKYRALSDSIFNEESAAKIIELQTLYDTEMKEKENVILRERQRVQLLRNRLLTLVAIIFAIMAISFFFMFRLKRYTLRQKSELFDKETVISQMKLNASEEKNRNLQETLFAEEEIRKLQAKSLDQKKHELVSATMLIASKNEVFEQLKKLAEEIKIADDGIGSEKAREIITEIDRQTDMETQWEQFRIRFESVHKSFFDKLRKADGGLTQNDLQLCAYLKLNLTTKEIARLMNISPESVNTSRYRLRKKLNLANSITLDEFIHNL